jgi:hypothetical protein
MKIDVFMKIPLTCLIAADGSRAEEKFDRVVATSKTGSRAVRVDIAADGSGQQVRR